MALPSAADIISNPGDIKSLFGLNPATIGDLAVDISETYTTPRIAQITERPVETGFPVTDARSIQPQLITMECMFFDPSVAGKDIAKQAIQGTLVQSLTTSWREKRDRLYEIFYSQELISVSTYREDFDNVVITEIIPETNARLANCFRCTVHMREIRQVTSALGFVDPRSLLWIPGRCPQRRSKKRRPSKKTCARKRNHRPRTKAKSSRKQVRKKRAASLTACCLVAVR
jgi:hypothetical protein